MLDITLPDYVTLIKSGKHNGCRCYNELEAGGDEILFIELYFMFLYHSQNNKNCYHITTQPTHNLVLNNNELKLMSTCIENSMSDLNYEVNFESKYTPNILKIKQMYNHDNNLIHNTAYGDFFTWDAQTIDLYIIIPCETNGLLYFDLWVISNLNFNISTLKELKFQTSEITSINILNPQNIILSQFKIWFDSNNFKFNHNFLKEKDKKKSLENYHAFYETPRSKSLEKLVDEKYKIARDMHELYWLEVKEYRELPSTENFNKCELAWTNYEKFHEFYWIAESEWRDDRKLFCYEIEKLSFITSLWLNCFSGYINIYNDEITDCCVFFTNFPQLAGGVCLNSNLEIDMDGMYHFMGLIDLIFDSKYGIGLSINCFENRKNKNNLNDFLRRKKKGWKIPNISDKKH